VQGLPPAVAAAAFVLFGLVAVAYAAKEAARARRGLPVSWGKNLVVATTALTWFLGIVVLNSDYAFTVTNVLVHGVPYVGLVWFTERSRAAERAAAGRKPQLSDLAVRSVALFLLPLFLWPGSRMGLDRFVWHDQPVLFPGPRSTRRARARPPRPALRPSPGDALCPRRFHLEDAAGERRRGARRRPPEPA